MGRPSSNSSLATGEFARNLGLCAFSLLDLFVYPFLSEVLIHFLYSYIPLLLFLKLPAHG